MSEEQQNPPAAAPAEEHDGPRAGERLAAARREQNIGLHEVAKELHLDETKVRALETNDFAVLGAPVFAKGHLRKYSQLVGIDFADVLEDYYKLTRADAPMPIVSARPRIHQELSPGPWIALILVLAGLATAWWWTSVRETPVRERAPAAAPSLQDPDDAAAPADEAESETAAPADPPVSAVSETAAAPAAPPAATEQSQASRPAPAAAEAPAAVAGAEDDGVALTVMFSGDCWTEISDADGRRLFFATGRDGQTVELRGKAPLNAVFGNADNVRLLLDGNDYPMPESGRSDRTLRLSIRQP